MSAIIIATIQRQSFIQMSKLHDVRGRITYISSHAKQETFVGEAKHFYTDLINLLVKDEKEKLHVFDKDGLYLATKKIGKNTPKAEQIRADNEKRMQWNREVDRAIVSNVPEAEIGQVKTEYITDRIKASVDTFGSQQQLYGSIITTAVAVFVTSGFKGTEKSGGAKDTAQA